MFSNVFRLDRTIAESEEVGIENPLGVSQSEQIKSGEPALGDKDIDISNEDPQVNTALTVDQGSINDNALRAIEHQGHDVGESAETDYAEDVTIEDNESQASDDGRQEVRDDGIDIIEASESKYPNLDDQNDPEIEEFNVNDDTNGNNSSNEDSQDGSPVSQSEEMASYGDLAIENGQDDTDESGLGKLNDSKSERQLVDNEQDAKDETFVSKRKIITRTLLGVAIVGAGVYAVWPVEHYDPLGLGPLISKVTSSLQDGPKSQAQTFVMKGDEMRTDGVTSPVVKTQSPLSEAPKAKSALQLSIDSAVGEVAIHGDLNNEQKLGLVTSSINSERIALGQPLLSHDESKEAITYAAELLGVDAEIAQSVIQSQESVSKAIQATNSEFKSFLKGTEVETAQAIVDRLSEEAPDISFSDLSSAATVVASKNGIPQKIIDASIEGKKAENALIEAIVPSITPAESEEEVYQNTQAALKASFLAQTSKGGLSQDSVSFSIDKQMVLTESVGAKLGSNPESIAAAKAQIKAEHDARLEGKPVESQILLGKIAAAETIAESRNLGFYETALFVAEKVGSKQGIDSVAVNRNLSPLAKSIVTTHYDARKLQQDFYTATGTKPNHQKIISDVTGKVVDAARSTGASVDVQKDFAKYAVSAEASALGASPKDAAVALNRELSMIDARKSGLSDLAIIAVGSSVAAMANASSTGEVDRDNIQIGLKEAVSVIAGAGISPESQKSAISDVEKFLGAKTVPATTETSLAKVIETATLQAKEQGLSVIDTAAYIAKAKTEFATRQAGFTEMQTAVAVARAQARARAEAMNFTEARVADIEQRAGIAEIEALGIPSSDVNSLNHAIARFEGGSSLEAMSKNTANSDVGGITVNELSKVVEQLNRLESRFAALAAKVNDAVESSNKAEQSANSASRAIVQIQSIVNANTAELRGQRESLQAEIDRRASNNGWLSSRLCEIEAVSGVYSNPAACKTEYSRYRNDNAQPMVQYTQQPTNSYSLPPETTIYQPSVVSYENATGRVYAQIPESELSLTSQSDYVAQDACSVKNPHFGYLIISGDNAVITNRNGETQRVIKGSHIPGLGAVVAFQAAQEPRFVSFENGIVCRQ